MKIVMCVPNVSEGRDREKLAELVELLAGQPGIKLLDYSADADHNRSVYSYLGEPEAVLAATKLFAERVFSLVDMATHRGGHPRQGALDTVPFIPLGEATMADAVEVARAFGRTVGEWGVPVYYYEAAATSPERVSLVNVRRGEYEGLPAKLADSAWVPDEGPAAFVPSAGAVQVAARTPLIAFNVNLLTADLSVARRIADAVRQASGGYRCVRAMGIELAEAGRVQVSMNLTDYTKTPIPRVLETIRSEAARYGVAVCGAEFVGPVPLGALEEVVRHYLQVHDFSVDRIVEANLL